MKYKSIFHYKVDNVMIIEADSEEKLCEIVNKEIEKIESQSHEGCKFQIDYVESTEEK